MSDFDDRAQDPESGSLESGSAVSNDPTDGVDQGVDRETESIRYWSTVAAVGAIIGLIITVLLALLISQNERHDSATGLPAASSSAATMPGRAQPIPAR